MKSIFGAALLGAFTLCASFASAATFGPGDWVNQDGDSVAFAATATVTDQGTGVLFDLSVDNLSAVTGDIFQIGFEGANFALGDISGVVTNTGDAVTSLCNNCSGSFNGGLFQSGPYSMFDTMKSAYEVGQRRGDTLTPAQLWWLATVGSADALNLKDSIGNIAPGMDADLILIDRTAAPILSARTHRAEDISELLFALIILADDRSIAETISAGERIHPS